jgi:hypothetical protein
MENAIMTLFVGAEVLYVAKSQVRQAHWSH